MSRKPPANKRKRLESTRSQTSGISILSNMTRSSDGINDSDDKSSQISRCNCNGGLYRSRNDVINVVQPQINYDSAKVQPESKCKHRVSWDLCDEDEETFVKEFYGQANDSCTSNKMCNGQCQNKHKSPCIEIYAQSNVVTPSSALSVPCQCRNNIPQTGTNQMLSELHRNEVELRRKNSEQQILIEHLLKRDRINTERLLQRQKWEQRLSLSVTSLRDSTKYNPSPTDGNKVPKDNIYESLSPRSQSNILTEANGSAQNENVFKIPSGCASRVTQRRSRSCDFLLNDEETETFISQPVTNSLQMTSSSGYEHVAEHTSDTRSNCDDIGTHQDTLSYPYDFRKWFYFLLAFNAVIVLMNVTGVPFLYVALNSPEPPEQYICVRCDSLSKEYILKSTFVKQNDQCCLKSARQLLELFANVTRELASRPLAPQALKSEETYHEDIAMAQYKAHKREIIGNVSRVAWRNELEYPIQKMFKGLDPQSSSTVIKIPVSGLYYIYSRVHYKKPYKNRESNVMFGHSILKLGHIEGLEEILDSVEETCFPRTDIVRHTSHLHFVHNLTIGDSVYVRLDKDKDFVSAYTKFGLFLIKKNE